MRTAALKASKATVKKADNALAKKQAKVGAVEA
jgi:hypothetical protein